MAATLYDLVRENKRNTWLLAFSFSASVIGLAAFFGYAIAVTQYPGSEQHVTLVAVAVAFAVTVVMLTFSYFGGAGTLLSISGARPLVKEEDPQLYNVIEELAIAGGQPVPKIYLIEDSAPNAFATGRNPDHAIVAITRGLRDKLTRAELQAVMAHEMSHVRNYDILFAMMMAVLVGVVVLLADYFRRSLWYGGRRSSRRSSKGGGAVIVILIVAIVLSIIAPILAKIIELAVSRQREYLADASAVDLTRDPDALASALAKISNDPEVLEAANRATQHLYIVNPIKSFEERASSLFSTHPPIKDRIARILSLKHA
ncbi:MAG: M48 family metallopeptidase [Phycisphaerae bacterium]|nr:M48 family metallopeptidase [Phycisphaerae bacterium]